MSAPTKYSPATIVAHWLFAALMIAIFVVGKTYESTPISETKLSWFMLHAGLGIVAGLVLITKIVLFFKAPRPDADPSWPTWMKLSSKLIHVLLYVAPLALVASGMAMGMMAGLMKLAIAGNVQGWPAQLEGPAAALHGLAVPVLLASFILHVVAALYHQHVMKDNLMNRISPLG